MKRILPILAIAALPGIAGAQALNEPFTTSVTGVFPPTGWTATNTNPPGGGEWVEAFNTPYTFPNQLVQDAAAHDYEYLSGITCDDNLDSPVIDLSSYGSPELTFVSDVYWVAWMAHFLPTPNSDGESHVFISTDGGTTFSTTPVWSEDTQVNGVINEVVDLSGVAANQASVVVRFHYYGYDAHCWAIDDVVVDNVGPVGPSIALGGSCPGPMSINASGMTPGGPVAFGYGAAGTTILPGGACAGATIPLAPGATKLGIVAADGSGNATLAGNAPPAACGNIYVVGFDVGTCTATNTAMP